MPSVAACRWEIQPLSGACDLVAASGGVSCVAPAGDQASASIRILPLVAAGGAATWTLLAGREIPIRINGQPLLLGIRVLRDRDELSVAGSRWFLSTEELASVVPFPGLDQPAFCPRCRQKLEMGDLAVQCPHCRAWHHQSEKFPCWSYAPACALCQLQSSALDAGYSWTPEQL